MKPIGTDEPASGLRRASHLRLRGLLNINDDPRICLAAVQSAHTTFRRHHFLRLLKVREWSPTDDFPNSGRVPRVFPAKPRCPDPFGRIMTVEVRLVPFL